jgi:cbb3-type cytochrome oxidase subunit 3
MLRFIKHNLTSMLGIEIYPLFSLVLFTLFFAIVLLYVWKMSKTRVNEMSALPLEFEQEDTNIKIEHL